MRRGWRLWAVAIVVVLVAAGCDADWTQFGFGEGNTRSSSESSINLVNVSTLAPDWTGPTGAVATSSPAVAGGVAYIGSGNGKLLAFRADGSSGCSGSPKTCVPLWTASTAGAIASSPAVSGGLVFVGSNDGKLYAFDAAGSSGCSGTPKVCAPVWTASTGGPVTSSPTVADGVVYVGSNDGKLYAFSAVGTARCSGSPLVCTPRWTGSTGGAVSSSPAISGGTAFVGSADGKLYAFDAGGADGCSGSPTVCAPKWTAATGGAVTASPAVANGKVFVGSSDRKLYAFDAGGAAGCSDVPLTCSPLWTVTTGGPISSSPAVAGSDLFVGSDDGNLYAIDAATTARCSGVPRTCSPRWTGSVGSQVRSSPAVAGGVVYVGSSDGDLRAFDAAGGLNCSTGSSVVCSSVWSASTDLGVRSSPIVSHGRVYVGSDDARLHVYRATGSTTPTPPVVAAPHVIPGDGEVTVRWTAATRVDLPIAGYIVQPYRAGVAQAPTTVAPSTTSLTLTGLDGGAAYSFTVAVKVADVVGVSSPLSDSEVPSKDLAPATYQINPTHDGNKRGEPLPAAPTLKWSKTFNNRVSYPVAANGRVFVTVGDDGAGAYGARLYAFDQATGDPLWGPVQVGGTYYITGLAYEDHKVYTINYNGILEALDEATGDELWSVDLPGQYAFTSPPTAYRGVVYTGGAGSGGTLYAVDGQTGQVLWTGSVSNGDHSAPAADASGVYVSYACAVTYRFDPATGARAWTHTTGCSGGGGSTPVLVGNRLYVRDGSSGNAILDTATGGSVGTFSAGPAPAFDGALRFGVSGGTVTAVNTTNGQTVWSRTGDGTLVSAPIVVGGLVVVGGTSGIVQAYDEQTGAVAWTLAAGAGLESPDEHNAWNLTGSTTDDGRLFVAAGKRLVAFG